MMKPAWLASPSDGVDVFVPDGDLDAALARGWTVGIAAHADDLELAMAPSEIEGGAATRFVGVTCTDGAGSPRAPGPETLSRDEYVAVRRAEQRHAAQVASYAAQIQLGHPSGEVVGPAGRESLVEQLVDILRAVRPQRVLTHTPTDRHTTHIAVALATIEACRRLGIDERPALLLGVDVWGALDWVEDRVVLPVSDPTDLATRLVDCHVSQVSYAPYGVAARGRRRANAVFADPHDVAEHEQVVLAVDMTVLLDPDVRVEDFVAARYERAASAAGDRLRLVL